MRALSPSSTSSMASETPFGNIEAAMEASRNAHRMDGLPSGRTGGAHPPYAVADVVGDEQCPGLVDGEADGPSHRFAVRIAETRQDIDLWAQRFTSDVRQ